MRPASRKKIPQMKEHFLARFAIFAEGVKTWPESFSSDALNDIFQRISRSFAGPAHVIDPAA
jgi:hypothetical protein